MVCSLPSQKSFMKLCGTNWIEEIFPTLYIGERLASSPRQNYNACTEAIWTNGLLQEINYYQLLPCRYLIHQPYMIGDLIKIFHHFGLSNQISILFLGMDCKKIYSTPEPDATSSTSPFTFFRSIVLP